MCASETVGLRLVTLIVAKATDSTSVRTMTLPFEEKTLTGSYFGSCVPRVDFPRMLGLYLAGRLGPDPGDTAAEAWVDAYLRVNLAADMR